MQVSPPFSQPNRDQPDGADECGDTTEVLLSINDVHFPPNLLVNSLIHLRLGSWEYNAIDVPIEPHRGQALGLFLDFLTCFGQYIGMARPQSAF